MAESEEEWIRKRAYALWEEEGYPSGKDREHWERAKLEYATLKPTASNAPLATTPRKKTATALKPEPKPKASKTAAPKPASAKTAAEKTSAKTPAAAIPAAVEPAKKRSKKVPAGE